MIARATLWLGLVSTIAIAVGCGGLIITWGDRLFLQILLLGLLGGVISAAVDIADERWNAKDE